MTFIDKDTIVIDNIFPMYFKKNILREKYKEFAQDNRLKSTELYLGGWGNGYVGLPFWHPYYEMHYDKIPVNVHGGLTYSHLDDTTDLWVIGFDTNHGGDHLHNCSFEQVEENPSQSRNTVAVWHGFSLF